MGGDGSIGGGDKFGDVLVAVMGIKHRRGVGLVEDKRACRDRFRLIPDEAIGGGGAVWLPAVADDAEVVVVGEAVEPVGAAVGGCLQMKAAASLVVEGH